MCIHDSGVDRNLDTHNSSSTPTRPGPALTPPPSTPPPTDPVHPPHPPRSALLTPPRPVSPPPPVPPPTSPKLILTPPTTHIHAVPVHPSHASAWSVACESIAQRLANQCLEHQPKLAPSASTVHIDLAHFFIASVY
ncbi:hypothetical protein SprV_0602210900 [Sparganum proliferum]